MVSKKTVKVAGFVGALCASAALVATAATGTGAYFTDSHSGNLVDTSGHLQLSTTDTNISFTGLNPGQDKSQQIQYTPTANSTSNEDVWLVFDTTSTAYGQFTGAKGANYGGYTGGGLGGYGHFKVISDQGYDFESYNLQVAPAGQGCNINAEGNGGSAAKATGPDNGSQSAPECGVPAAIKIGSNLAPGQTGGRHRHLRPDRQGGVRPGHGVGRTSRSRSSPPRPASGRTRRTTRPATIGSTRGSIRERAAGLPASRPRVRLRGGEPMRLLRWALLACVLAVVVTGAGYWHAGYRVYIVHTGSMMPTYDPGDIVIDKPAAVGRQAWPGHHLPA